MVDHRLTRILLSLVMLLVPLGAVVAQEEKESRPIGLPGGLEWKFNVDASASFYTFGHSLYANAHNGNDSPSDLGSRWLESFVRPALSATYSLKSSELFGKFSVVGERTTSVGKNPATTPGLIGGNADSFYPEDAYLGWRSGSALSGLDTNAIELSFGRESYTIGHGFLLYDGASEGGSRGGYWSNARKAFALVGLAKMNSGAHKLELFYLDKDELPESDSKSRVWGANYEFNLGDPLAVGATYFRSMADTAIRPLRDGMNIFDIRLYSTPLVGIPLAFEGEYAAEQNGDLMSANGWYTQLSYQLNKVAWSPKLSYRYAFFSGDDPTTPKSEAFDPLFLGFYDWGAWWQGEIAGEYFLSNSNLKSHQIRLHASPSDAIGTGLFYYVFQLARPEALGITAIDVANEIDWYMDWKINTNFSASFLLAWTSPGEVVKQLYGRTQDFTYGMLYFQYSY